MSDQTATSTVLELGFRFHPTDEELVGYFLKRKVCGKPFPFNAISEIDIYKSEPWDLPDLSLLKSRDLEWYFFSALDRKYGSGSRTNRATERGYWKMTGKDREVQCNGRTVGMKKTLVFHVGRAPHGERMNWVMHEYRLEDSKLVEAGVAQDAFVVCRVFQKSGLGPKNGEQYGAPFIEEEWDDNVLEPQNESGDGNSIFDAGEQSYIQPIYHEKNTEMGVIYGNAAPVMSFNGPARCNNSENPAGFLEGAHGQQVLDCMGENFDLHELHNNRELFNGVAENTPSAEEPGDNDFFISMSGIINSPEVYQTCPQFNDENFIEWNDIVNPVEADCPNGEIADDHLMYFDAPAAHNQQPIEDGSFLEAKDLLNPVEADCSGFEMLDDLLMYFDATDNNLYYENLASSCNQSEMVDPTLDQSNLYEKADEGTVWSYPACQVASASSSNIKPEIGSRDENSSSKATNIAIAPDVRYEGGWSASLTKTFSSLLESIPSSPAFAAEYPPKGSVKSIQQNSANNSSSIHVNTEAFFISELTVTGSTKQWSVQEGDVGFLLSYGMRRGDVSSKHVIGRSDGLESLAEIPSKATSAMTRSGLYLCFSWVLMLAASFKIGSYFYTR